MNIDGYTNVEERKEIFIGRYFTTYEYIFKNGNKIRECKPHKLKKNARKNSNIDEWINNNSWKRI